MVLEGQDFIFHLEKRSSFSGIHPRLDEFQSNVVMDRVSPQMKSKQLSMESLKSNH